MAPANTPIGLTLKSPLSSKNNVTGDKFSMTVAQDLMIDERFAVPKGTRAVGLITYTKGNGSFGSPARWKSPSSISNSAASRSRWTASIFTRVEGNTAGTVGAVLAAGVTGGLVVKGESADIVGGKDFIAPLLRDVPLEAAGRGSTSQARDGLDADRDRQGTREAL